MFTTETQRHREEKKENAHYSLSALCLLSSLCLCVSVVHFFFPQYSSMSCPRAGPVLNFVRSTLNVSSSFISPEPTRTSFTQKSLDDLSIVLNSEFVTYIRLPSPSGAACSVAPPA